MTRLSKHEIRNGRVWNGFDYELQVWVVNGNIQHCGHPDTSAHQKTSAAMPIVLRDEASSMCRMHKEETDAAIRIC
jgi:hypothetical protein